MVNNASSFAKINSQLLKEQKDMALHYKESLFIFILSLLWATGKEYIFLYVLSTKQFYPWFQLQYFPTEINQRIKNIYNILEAICTFSQDKQIRHLPDAIKLLSLAWYHTTTACTNIIMLYSWKIWEAKHKLWRTASNRKAKNDVRI